MPSSHLDLPLMPLSGISGVFQFIPSLSRQLSEVDVMTEQYGCHASNAACGRCSVNEERLESHFCPLPGMWYMTDRE